MARIVLNIIQVILIVIAVCIPFSVSNEKLNGFILIIPAYLFFYYALREGYLIDSLNTVILRLGWFIILVALLIVYYQDSVSNIL